MDGKGGRLPCTGGVARRAVCWNSQGRVVRVGTLIVILRMTGRAICWRAGIPRGMTGRAGRADVRAGQGEVGFAVIEPVVSLAGRMAGQAGGTVVGIAVHAIVVVIRFRVGMAGDAGKFGVIRRIRMAVQALLPFSLVLPAVNREIVGIVLGVFCRHPVRIGRMALDTILGKARRLVIGAQSGFIIVFMTGYTIGRDI